MFIFIITMKCIVYTEQFLGRPLSEIAKIFLYDIFFIYELFALFSLQIETFSISFYFNKNLWVFYCKFFPFFFLPFIFAKSFAIQILNSWHTLLFISLYLFITLFTQRMYSDKDIFTPFLFLWRPIFSPGNWWPFLDPYAYFNFYSN